MEAIDAEVARQAVDPPSGDQHIAAMWQAYPRVKASEPALSAVIETFVASQQVMTDEWAVAGLPVSEVVGTLRLAFQYDCVWHGRSRFPVTRRGWERLMRGMVRDPERLATFTTIVGKYRPKTCSGERYGPLEVLRQLDDGIAGERMSLWDGGAGIQIGVNQLQLKHLFPFYPATLLTPDGQPDEVSTEGYANLVGLPAIAGEVVTTDLNAPESRLVGKLALASLRPEEINDRNYRKRYRELSNARLPNVHFLQGDIADDKEMRTIWEKREAAGLAPARHGFLGTVLNQIGQARVARAIKNALSLLSEDGKLIIAEFGHPDRRDPRKFFLLPNWSEFTYGYFVIHKEDENRVINPIFTFQSSRPRLGRTEEGLYEANGRLLPIRHHLAKAAVSSIARALAHRPPTSSTPS